jgi:hypothetical protein
MFVAPPIYSLIVFHIPAVQTCQVRHEGYSKGFEVMRKLAILANEIARIVPSSGHI